jgi:hypothetical protein
MNDNRHQTVEGQRLLVEQVHRAATDQDPIKSLPATVESPTLAFTELPEAQPDSPLDHEWNFYRGQVKRLLEEGYEGQFVLIKGEQIIGIWGTHEEAKAVALRKFLMQPCLIHQVRSQEPLVRMSARFWGCQS